MSDNSKSRAKIQAQRNKAAEKEYKQKLKSLEKFGIYSPKEKELTRSRRTTINKKFDQYSDVITRPDKYLFVKPDKIEKKKARAFLRDAGDLGFTKTKTGVFIQSEGHKRARVEINRTTEEANIVLTGKVKRGENKGKAYKNSIPIVPLSTLDGDKSRLDAMARDMARGMKDGEAISFVVKEKGQVTGAHRSTYTNVEDLMNKINSYHTDNNAARLRFLRLISIQKTTPLKWRELHPAPANRMASVVKGRGRKGKRHPNER